MAPSKEAPVPATRVEIVECLASVFSGTPLDRDKLVAAAESAGARPAVLELLGRLPQRRQFSHVRELWGCLPDVPIERDG